MPEDALMRPAESCECASVVKCMPVQEAAMLRKGCREISLPVQNAAVAAAGVGAVARAQSQYDLIVTRYWVSPSIAAFFLITQWEIGTVGQLAETNPILADQFVPNNQSNTLLLTPLKTSQFFTITLTNLDPVNAHRYGSVAKGYVHQWC